MKTFLWLSLCSILLCTTAYLGFDIYLIGIEHGIKQGIQQQIIGWDLSEAKDGSFVFKPIIKEKD